MGVYWFRAFEDGCRSDKYEVTVHHNRFVRNRIGIQKYMEMNVNNFIVAPGYVMIDKEEPVQESDTPQLTAENYIKKGCTLLLIQHRVTSLKHYRAMYESHVDLLVSLPVDYMMIPVVPACKITPEIIRFFARKGCPFISIEIQSLSDLYTIKWEWLVQAQAHKRIPLTIFVNEPENTSHNYTEIWSSIASQYGIIKLTDLQEDEYLSRQNMKDSGIYPLRGTLHPGGQADYNLYTVLEPPTFEDEQNFSYHKSVPTITVVCGKPKQVNQTIIDRTPGKHVPVMIHKHFV